jgi:hypothetical protein
MASSTRATNIKFADLCLSVQGIVRAISSLNSWPDAMQAPTACVLVTQLIKCTSIEAFPSYSSFLCFADVSFIFKDFLFICKTVSLLHSRFIGETSLPVVL